MRRALAKLFEVVDYQVQSLDFFSQLSLALLNLRISQSAGSVDKARAPN
jgi:hypothetical protein